MCEFWQKNSVENEKEDKDLVSLFRKTQGITRIF